jgi:HlyD family secretion protein
MLDGLNLQLPQAQLRYEHAVTQYENLLEPPDPLDVAAARAAVEAAQAQLDDARKQYDRIKDGYSEADLAVLQAQLDDARREYERVKNGPPPDDVAALEAQIAAAQAVAAQAQVTAPFSGTLTEVYARPGDQVAPGTPAFRVDDLSRLLVDASVSEVDINRVQVGQEAVITLDGVFAREYRGRVVEVAPVGVETRGVTTFPVTVEILDADEAVRPGMTADVQIITRSMEDVLLIPSRALRMLNGERVVYVLPPEGEPLDGTRQGLPFFSVGQASESSLTPVPVILGVSANGYSEVLSGDLKEGDLVVLNPPE